MFNPNQENEQVVVKKGTVNAEFEHNSDCPACSRNLPHTRAEHEAALKRNYCNSIDAPIDTWDDW